MNRFHRARNSTDQRQEIRRSGFVSISFPFPACLLVSALLLTCGTLPAHSEGPDERMLRAAFVFNLTKYVQWPRASSELVIGVVGGGAMGEILKGMLEGKDSDSRRIHVLATVTDEQLAECDLLYVAVSHEAGFHASIEKLRGRAILTVGETDSFLQNGGAIGLVRGGEQIQIHVNLQAATDSQIKISSRLLNLSTITRVAPGARN